MAIAAIGWARMGILVLILVDCIAINTQFIIGLLQILNRSSDAQGNEQHADRSVLAGIIAALHRTAGPPAHPRGHAALGHRHARRRAPALALPRHRRTGGVRLTSTWCISS